MAKLSVFNAKLQLSKIVIESISLIQLKIYGAMECLFHSGLCGNYTGFLKPRVVRWALAT